jgi:hypothetical protein
MGPTVYLRPTPCTGVKGTAKAKLIAEIIPRGGNPCVWVQSRGTNFVCAKWRPGSGDAWDPPEDRLCPSAHHPSTAHPRGPLPAWCLQHLRLLLDPRTQYFSSLSARHAQYCSLTPYVTAPTHNLARTYVPGMPSTATSSLLQTQTMRAA